MNIRLYREWDKLIDQINEKQNKELFRLSGSGEIYKYDRNQRAYLFCGHTDTADMQSFINEYC